MYFASCNDDSATDDLQPKTETVAPATDDKATTTDDDPAITTRGLCTSGCPIDIDMTSGDTILIVCGDLNSSTGCTAFTSSCGSSNYPFATTLIPTSTMCFCVPAGR
ncbi:MAG: hypothetical protein AAB316_03360, partial [Bacteroidota bacterium]